MSSSFLPLFLVWDSMTLFYIDNPSRHRFSVRTERGRGTRQTPGPITLGVCVCVCETMRGCWGKEKGEWEGGGGGDGYNVRYSAWQAGHSTAKVVAEHPPRHGNTPRLRGC